MADQTPGPGAFERSREQRRGVRQASADLEEALARPATQDPKVWSGDTADCLQVLFVAFESHAHQSEGPDGLLAEIIDIAPRLANSVQQVKREHETILKNIHNLEAETRGNEDADRIQAVRSQALDLLQTVAGHRQRGADLIYDAYTVDIEAGD